MENAERYEKLLEYREACAVPRRDWELVLRNGATGEELRGGFELLQEYQGCWILADAIICRLDTVAMPPRFTLITWPESWMWFSLGSYLNIFLPRARPAAQP